MARVTGDESGQNAIAVVGKGIGQDSLGVLGQGDAVGVRGEGKNWHGVTGLSKSTTGGHGVYGKNTAGGTGVVGESDGWMGVYGKSQSTSGGAGVMGEGDPGPGVIGKSTKWIGVYGETAGINGPAGVMGEHKGAGVGVKAVSKDDAGLAAYSTGNEAIHAETKSPTTAAIAAYNLNPNGTGAAIFGKKEGTQGHAGFFVGNVEITGSLSVQGVSIQGLLQRIEELEALRVTDGGVPVRPVTRPNITVEMHAVTDEVAMMTVKGSGFKTIGNRRLTLDIFKNTVQSKEDLGSAKPDGTFFFGKQIAYRLGDVLRFSASDGRDDPNDRTGVLWSNTVKIPVP